MNLIDRYEREKRRQQLHDRWAHLTRPIVNVMKAAMKKAATTGEELPTHMDIKTARGMVTVKFPLDRSKVHLDVST